MRKRLYMLLLVVLISGMMVAYVCAGGIVGDEEALMSQLNHYREESSVSFQIGLEKAYFDDMCASGFDRLVVLLLKCGMAEHSMSYYPDGTLMFSNVVWGNARMAECKAEGDVEIALEGFLKEGTDSFQIICPGELCSTLGENYFFSRMARHGVENFTLQYSGDDPRIFYFSDIQPYTVPWAFAVDEDAFRNAVEYMYQIQADDFYIVPEKDLFNSLREDPEKLKLLANASRMETWSSLEEIGACRYRFNSVTYTDDPCLLCTTETEIQDAVRQMGAAGIQTFRLILSQTLYDSIEADSFGALEALTSEAGMIGSEMKYASGGTILYYDNAAIQTDMTRLTTMKEAAAYICESAAAGDTDIVLFCDKDLYTRLISGISPNEIKNNGMALLYDVISEAGIFRYTFTHSSASGIINIKVQSFYPGTNILRAVKSGDSSRLSARERETLVEASRLSGKLCVNNPLETARGIHDWLCKRIAYTDDDSTDEDDTAIGAILNGKANCDGYADAFYLIGTLSGLNVRYQHGDSNLAGRPETLQEEATHMWNLLELDGTWRLVDVTWDDAEDQILYAWFNIGEDRAARCHVWNREATVPLLARTDLSVRPENEYWISRAAEAFLAMDDIAGNGYENFTLIYESRETDTHLEDIETLTSIAADSFRYSWEDRMLMLTVSGYTSR